MPGPTSASLTFTVRASSSLASLALSPGHPARAQHLHLPPLALPSPRHSCWYTYRRLTLSSGCSGLCLFSTPSSALRCWPLVLKIFLKTVFISTLCNLAIPLGSRTHARTHTLVVVLLSLSNFLSSLLFHSLSPTLWILPQWDPSFYLFSRITFLNNKSPKCLCRSQLGWEILIWSKLTLKWPHTLLLKDDSWSLAVKMR